MLLSTTVIIIMCLALSTADIAYQYRTRFDYDYYNDQGDCLDHGDCDGAIDRQANSDALANILDPLDSVRTIFNQIDPSLIYTSLTSNSNILQRFITKYIEVRGSGTSVG